MRRRLDLCADDFGLTPALSASLAELAGRGRLSSLSCLVAAPHWKAAAPRLAALAAAMIEQRTSGVTLDLARLGEAGERAPRAPQVRQRLVERGS